MAGCFIVAATTLIAETAQERMKEATAVFSEIMATPEKGIPEELLGKARCVVIIPGMKSGAIGIGGKYGRGYAMCRSNWGPAGVHPQQCGWRVAASVFRLAANPRTSSC